MLNFCNVSEIEVMADLIWQIIQTGKKRFEIYFSIFFGTQPDCQPASLTDFQPSTLRGFHFHLLTLWPLKNSKHLIFPHNITPELHNEDMRIKEMITQTMMGCKRLINQASASQPQALQLYELVSLIYSLAFFIDILGDEILVSDLIHIHLKRNCNKSLCTA